MHEQLACGHPICAPAFGAGKPLLPPRKLAIDLYLVLPPQTHTLFNLAVNFAPDFALKRSS
eukprot:1151217-Pelagomonas_calceolata.AAC.1